MFGTLKKWTGRAVYSVEHKARIAAHVETKHGLTPRDPQYLGQFQKSLTEMIERLSKTEAKKYEDKAERWNEEGTPMELRRQFVFGILFWRSPDLSSRRAAAQGPHYVRWFAEQLYDHCGMRVLVFSGRQQEDGKVMVCRLVPRYI